MKKSLVDMVEEKLRERNEHDTLGKDQPICPFCGHEHDAEGLDLSKKSRGLLKCLDCGEAFEFEVIRKVVYTTFEP